ncbi:MAG: BRCT domain-containing protein, partial [Cyanobacteria bacterium J06623_5]
SETTQSETTQSETTQSETTQSETKSAQNNTPKNSTPKNNTPKQGKTPKKATNTVSAEAEKPITEASTAPKAESSTTKEGPLSGKIFVITGKLHQITYEQIADTVTSAGGRINKMPSAKTDYIVVGDNPGNKLKKAIKCNVPQLDEAQLLELLETL